MPRHGADTYDEPVGRGSLSASGRLKADLQGSVAELRLPGGCARLGQWLAIAASYTLAGAALVYGMNDLYFSAARLRCEGDLDGDAARRHIEHFLISTAPAQARAWCCWAPRRPRRAAKRRAREAAAWASPQRC